MDEWQEQYDKDQRELDELLADLEIFEEKSNTKIDGMFDYYDILCDLKEKLDVFISNIEAIRQGILSFDNKTEVSQNFLNGTFLVGFVSAYEGFIHDYFEVCCSKKKYIQLALANIENLEKKDLRQLRLQSVKKRTEAYLKKRLTESTLHDPVQIARISLVLFNLKMLELDNDEAKQLLDQRNIFTHNGGLSDGKPLEITREYLISIYHAIYTLINSYFSAMKDHADEFEKEEI